MTAHMNAAYQAHNGLPPDIFPEAIPVYTGHYHLPHTVAGTSITYVGSPYQGGATGRLTYVLHSNHTNSQLNNKLSQ